jgi:hypothetical protein
MVFLPGILPCEPAGTFTPPNYLSEYAYRASDSQHTQALLCSSPRTYARSSNNCVDPFPTVLDPVPTDKDNNRIFLCVA